MKILFATDLDNTLIHSYKYASKDDICVEYINDKENTYMSKYVYSQLPILVNKIKIIPITTRTMAQYNRINFPNNCINKAVTTNGAFILENGIITEYKAESDSLYIEDLKKIEYALQKDTEAESIKYADDKYLYAVYKNQDIAESMSKLYNFTSIIPAVSGRKLYFIPPYYKKDIALKNLAQDYDFTIAAGDSDLDVSMLNIANMSIVHSNIANKVNCKNKIVCPSDKPFSDFIIDTIKSFIS